MIATVEAFRERTINSWGTPYYEIAVTSEFDPDRSIACASWREDRCDEWSVWSVETHPDYRRRGLASACMVEILRRARERGVRRVWLYSERKAIPLYRSLGFTAPYGEGSATPYMEVEL